MASKLNPEAAMRICRLAAEGEMVKDLATLFGVGRETIRRVIRGETWEKQTFVPEVKHGTSEQEKKAAQVSQEKFLQKLSQLGNEPEEEQTGMHRLMEEAKRNPDVMLDELKKEA